MKKLSIQIVAAVLLTTVLIGGILCGFLYFYHQENTYVVIDGVEYDRTLESLDLSGQSLSEWEKLTELKQLQTLDLRQTDLAADVYDALHSALPECEIRWSIPFQGSRYDNDTTELTITSLTEADLATLAYFSDLTVIHAENCSDSRLFPLLMDQYPHLMVGCTLTLSGQQYHTLESEVLTIENPDVEELRSYLDYFPYVDDVYLTGTMPEIAALASLKADMPDYTFIWDLEVCGVQTNTLAENLDLSGIVMADTQALEQALPCFYQLEKVEMSDCGIPNEDMASLNRRYPGTQFVWTVQIGRYIELRTDVTSFMPNKFGYEVSSEDCVNLKYCTDIIALDFGHNPLSDVSFLNYMPHVQYLLLGDTPVTDLTPLAGLTELKYLEIFLTEAADLWPLIGCTSLEDLNLCFTPYGDYSPLYQMTWLDRLWLVGCFLDTAGQAELKEALPNTAILIKSDSSTNKGWRLSPNYYAQRDIFEMYYMTK